MKNNTLIIYNSVEYFEPLIKNRGYEIVYLRDNIFSKIIKKITSIFNIQKNKIKNNNSIIIFAPVDIAFIKYIKKINPNARIIYWYWNPAYRIGRPTEELRNIAELWSFDSKDCERYMMNYNNTFFFNNIKLKESHLLYDIAFVGRNKHRQEKLYEIQNTFNELNINSLFHIVPNRNEPNENNIKELKYEEYLSIISSSKAILEIMPPVQEGLTLRAMESIFFCKKLITDNINIIKEPFYNSQNIFILGKDDINQLKEFLSSPYSPIPQEIIEYYEFQNWINRIIKKSL